MTTSFDPTKTGTGTAGAVSAVKDTRVLAPWFAKMAAGTPVVAVVSGDSTTQRQAGSSSNYSGTLIPNFANNLPSSTKVYNRGGSGGTSVHFASTSFINDQSLDCSSVGVAALTPDIVFASWGINDCKADASIIGAYGNAGQLAKAAAIRANFKIAYDRIKAANPACVFIWRMPNAHNIASAGYFANGVTGQHCMNVYRLLYRGDPVFGILPIDQVFADSLMMDTFRLIYRDTAYTSATTLIDADGLHEGNGAQLIPTCMGALINPVALGVYQPRTNREAAQWKAIEQNLSRSAILPLTLATIIDSEEFALVADGTTGTNGTTYMDYLPSVNGLGISATGVVTSLYGGAAAAAFGSANEPAVSLGDILVIEPVGSSPIILRLVNPPDTNGTGYMRWTAAFPDGIAYPVVAAQGARARIFRHRYAGSESYRNQAKRRNAVGAARSLSYVNTYFAQVVSATNGSITVRGTRFSDGTDMVAHTITGADALCLPGVEGTGFGFLLTGATVLPGVPPGVQVITLAGTDFRTFGTGQCVILSDT